MAAAATRNTDAQLPVAVFSTFANGTRKADVPFAVYSRLAFAVAYFGPNVSVQVEGNSEKISPQVKKISPAQSTNAQGVRPSTASNQ